MEFIEEIEKQIGINAKKEMLPMQPGDVNRTWADVDVLKTSFDNQPKTSIKEGIKKFIDWYKWFY